jgi:hypothetical protein
VGGSKIASPQATKRRQDVVADALRLDMRVLGSDAKPTCVKIARAEFSNRETRCVESAVFGLTQ